MERSRTFRALTRFDGLEVEPHVYKAEEFAAMIAREDPLAMRIMAEGKILCEQRTTIKTKRGGAVLQASAIESAGFS